MEGVQRRGRKEQKGYGGLQKEVKPKVVVSWMRGVSLGKHGEQSKGLEARVNLEKETCQVVNSLKLSYQESQDWSDRSLFTT